MTLFFSTSQSSHLAPAVFRRVMQSRSAGLPARRVKASSHQGLEASQLRRKWFNKLPKMCQDVSIEYHSELARMMARIYPIRSILCAAQPRLSHMILPLAFMSGLVRGNTGDLF